MHGLPPRRRTLPFGALLLAGVAACDGRETRPSTPTRAPVAGVVVVCVDTLRADALSTDPARPGPMPTLDAFARSGTAFLDASSSAAWTAPAVATLLTGLDPTHTGVRGQVSASNLVPAVPTLAARLKAVGWSTWAFTGGAIVAPDRGLDAGFDAFSTRFDLDGPEACIERWRRERAVGAPWFLFLHTYAAHDPYGPKDVPPERGRAASERAQALLGESLENGGKLSRESILWFLETFLADPAARNAFFADLGEARARRIWQDVLDWIDGPGLGTPELAAVGARLRASYRAGLVGVDRVLHRTLAALERAGVGEDAAVVVLGDHGEAFGEHGTVSHGRRLYDELTRIPLVVRAPGRFPAGARVRGSCGIVDVAPTVLDLARVGAADALDGVSLRALAAGTASGHPVLAEEERYEKDGAYVPLRTASVRVPAAKYVVTWNLRTRAVVREELYDLARDPRETTLLPTSGIPAFGAPLCAAVHALRSGFPTLDAGLPCLAEVAAASR
jgi:arylsulfatase A-like enzyme